MGSVMKGMPGHMSRLNVGLLFKEAAVAGRACKMRDRPPSPSALMAHLMATPLGGCSLALSDKSSEKCTKIIMLSV